MIVRSIGRSLVKECSHTPLSTVACKCIAASPLGGQLASSTEATRGFSTTNNRTFSSLPLHTFAQKNNGMVNVLVKSTKVPRPIAMVPLKKKQPKVKNKLKERRGANLLQTTKPAMEDNDASPQKEERVPSHFSYAGNASLPITSELKIVLPEDDVPSGIWPCFRMMVRIFRGSCVVCFHMTLSHSINSLQNNSLLDSTTFRMRVATFVKWIQLAIPMEKTISPHRITTSPNSDRHSSCNIPTLPSTSSRVLYSKPPRMSILTPSLIIHCFVPTGR